MNAPILRLTALAHGGGCGCKLSPAVLRELLAEQPAAAPFANLLVGTETGDDAAVWRLDDETCIVATTDFFMPMVDDPFDFGRIAATNALSDVYAMGGKPIFALAVLGMPINSMPTAMIREILRGGAAMAAEAGIPVAGGHSIDSPEPIYGLAVVGLVSTKALRRNSEARPGDALILTKPLGVGIYSAAIKKGALSDDGYREMLGFMTRLNVVGAELARMKRSSRDDRCYGFRPPWPRARNGAGRRRHRPSAPRRCRRCSTQAENSRHAPASSRAPRTATGRAMARPSPCRPDSKTGGACC